MAGSSDKNKKYGYRPNLDDLIRGVSTKLGTEPKPIDIGLKETVNVGPTWGKHPYGVKESIKEKLIKGMAGISNQFMSKEDMPYLEQYLHPEYDILPKQELRPTIGQSPNIPFRHLDKSAATSQGTGIFSPKFLQKISPSSEFNTAGLGNFKFDERNPNYNSIYDIWDFNTNSPLVGQPQGKYNVISKGLNSIAKRFMQGAGQPYAVYERFDKSHWPGSI